MIPVDFDYYRPDSIDAAVELFRDLDAAGKQPVYYGGGTEIITMARVHNLSTGAVIDLKGIAECLELGVDSRGLVIGAGVTLTRISESKLWELMAKAGGRIADHTTQGKITIGGNICGTIIYHEALLPLFLTDSEVVVAGQGGRRQVSIHEVFNQRHCLSRGEFIIQIIIEKHYIGLPFVHVKRTKSEKIDYPLISLAALKKEDKIRVAFSGVCAFPFRSDEVEQRLNERPRSTEKRVQEAIQSLPAPLLSDVSGSAGYREFVLANTLRNILNSLEGKQDA